MDEEESGFIKCLIVIGEKEYRNVWEAISSIVIRDKSFLQKFPMFVLHVWYGNCTSGYKTSG